jgi:hypothetical protein
MRAWRALKTAGAAALRDGVYLLPEGEERHARLGEVAQDIAESGGQAYLLTAEPPEYPFAALFDRTEEYRQLAVDIQDSLTALETNAASDITRLARKLRKGFAALAAIDFFPGEAQRQVQARLDELDQHIRAKLEPDEPTAQAVPLLPHAPAAYQNRLWATRKRPWVDRLASAWLIHRFIDRKSRFLWLASPADCPPAALGFDFDGAAFSHRGEYVSFETLMHSFGLAADAALNKLARVVHYLDVGGLPAPEAAGLETLLAGMRASLADDDALLAAAAQAFDFLYAHYQQDAPAP